MHPRQARSFGPWGYSLTPTCQEWLPRVWALATLALMALTYPLWLPQSFHLFPQVPWIAAAGRLPEWADLLAACCLVVALGAVLLGPSGWTRQLAFSVVLISAVVLQLVDQQRFQPWAYQGLLYVLAWFALPPRRAGCWLRMLVISIYFYSAITKLDQTFLTSMGPYFLDGLSWAIGWQPQGAQGPWAWWLPWAFPLGEITLAVGFLWPRGRALVLSLSVMLHLTLLIILGPWGLNHQPAVLVWNAFFIVQNILLFGPPPRSNSPREPVNPLVRLAEGVFLAALILPLLEPLERFDIWPSWGLYAPRNQRVEVFICDSKVKNLPLVLRDRGSRRSLFEEAEPQQEWLRFRLDLWSLQELAAPIYPQHRSQLGVAQALALRYQLGQGVRVIRYQTADRFSGKRESHLLQGTAELIDQAEDYWPNAHSRDFLLRAP